MRPVIYMLDTNILVNWFYSRTPDFEGSLLTPWQCQYISDIRDFCEQNENDIYIPDLVWCEFLSVILHKEMELCADLDGFNQWFRDREIIIQQLELAIDGNPRLHRFLWAGTMSPYVDAEVLVRDPELIDDNLYQWLQNQFQKRKLPTRKPPKLLDGMDAVIMIYLNELAIQHPDQQVVLYSADLPLCRITSRIRKLYKSWFAQNIASVFPLYSKTRCRYCGREHSNAILRQYGVLCHNHPLRF